MKKFFVIFVLLIGSSTFLSSQCCDTSRCIISDFNIYKKGEKFRQSYYTSSRYCYGHQPYPPNLFDSLSVITVHKAINKACNIPFFEPQIVSLFIEKNVESSYWQITSKHKISGTSALANLKYRMVKINAKTGKIIKMKTIHSKAITHPYG